MEKIRDIIGYGSPGKAIKFAKTTHYDDIIIIVTNIPSGVSPLLLFHLVLFSLLNPLSIGTFTQRNTS